MELEEILFFGVLAVTTMYSGSINQINQFDFKLSNKALEYKNTKTNDTNISNDSNLNSLKYIEKNNQGKRKSLDKELFLNAKKMSKVHPNQEPRIIVEEFFGKDNFRYSKVKEELPSSGPGIGYWEDTKYFFNNKLIYTKRKAIFLSNQNKIIEGRLDKDNSTIIKNPKEKYILINKLGFIQYELEN